MELQLQIKKVEHICWLMENGEGYFRELTGYLPALERTISQLLACSQDPKIPFCINEQLVIQVLNDVLYGMEHQDVVYLLDTLRYGLLELYQYGRAGLQSEGEG